jgi:hypothetical protein
MENRIDATLTEANRDKILAGLNEIKTLLPFLQDLTPTERQKPGIRYGGGDARRA